MSIRTLFWLVSALLLVLAASEPVFALQGTTGFATGFKGLVVNAQGRKGTRIYTPDSSADYGALVEGQEKATATPDATSQEKLDQCMASWDAGTHITKQNWRKICERQLSDGGL
jgi:hypothetical protein